ncbi:MAG: GNAT family N-acetyltransferase, partial [Halobacteriales archaeon]
MRCASLSKLTRSKLARRAYDALVAAGLRVAVLDEFRRDLTSDPPERAAHPSISIDTSAVTTEAGTAADPTLDADRLRLEAVAEGTTIGRVQLMCSNPVAVPELDRAVDLSGGYLHDLLVEPEWRRSGVGSALVRAACVRLDERDISAAAARRPNSQPSPG